MHEPVLFIVGQGAAGATADKHTQAAPFLQQTGVNQLADLEQVELPPMIEVWNKLDLVEPFVLDGLKAELERQGDGQIAIPVSAITGDGLPQLLETIEAVLDRGRVRFQMRLRHSDGALRAWLYENTQVEAETYSDTGDIALQLSLTKDEFGRLAARFPEAVSAQLERVD